MNNIDALQFELLTPAFVFSCLLIVLGIPGNIISILVYGLQLKSTTGRYAIITLAICDITNCVMSIPVELYIMTRYWSFENAALCKMSRFVTYSMNNSSGLILVAIAFERYRTICSPHKPKIQKYYIKIICIVMVICGTLLALPALWIYGIQTDVLFVGEDLEIKTRKMIFDNNDIISTQHQNANTSYRALINQTFPFKAFRKTELKEDPMEFYNMTVTKRCLIDDRILNPWLAYSHFGFLTLAIIIVLFILIFVYGQIAWTIRGLKSMVSTPSDMERVKSSAAKKKQVTFMLFLITLAFEFSFIPFIIITNVRLFTYPEWYNNLGKGQKMVYHFFLRSYLINCAINPFIYCVSSSQFRSAILTLHKRFKSLKGR